MIGNGVARQLTGGFGFGNHTLEIVPLAVAQQVLQIAGKPELHTVFGTLGVALERDGKAVDKFGFHGCIPFRVRKKFIAHTPPALKSRAPGRVS